MNWLHRIGIAFLVVGTALGSASWGLRTNHAVNPVPIAELGLTPEAAEETKEFVATLEPLRILGADGDADNRTKRVSLGAAVYKANGDQWPWTGPQEVGDCTSMGTGRAIELDLAKSIENGAEFVWRAVDRPWIYYGGRVRNGRVQLSGDGAVPSWAVDWVRDKGVLWKEDAPEYNGGRAREWGRKGPPQSFYDKANPYRVTGAAAVESAQDACNAITAGYPVVFGSMRWGTNSIKLVEGRNVARDTANWPHSQCASGYDGTTIAYGERGLFYVDNSWGPEAHNPKSQMPGDQPGGYYVTWETFDAICKEGMAFSISGTQGFPKRGIDFSDWAVGAAGPQQEGNAVAMNTPLYVEIFEHPATPWVALASLLIGAAFLIAGRIRGNAFRRAIMGLTVAAAIVLPAQTITAQEISFAAFDVKSTSITSTASSECPLSFAAFEVATAADGEHTCKLSFGAFDCKCGPGCDCTDCDCGCSPPNVAAEPQAKRTQWLYFTTAWCVRCPQAVNDFRPWMEKSGWEVSPVQTAHVRIVDGDLEPETVRAFNVKSYPTFVLIQDGKEVLRHNGYPGRDALVKEYVSATARTPEQPQQAPQPPKEVAAPNGRVEIRFDTNKRNPN